MLLDGFTQVTELGEERYHEPLVHPAMLAHPKPKNVLLLGGGDGGSLREILKHKSVERLDFAELDPGVVSFCRKYLPGVHKGSFDDERVKHCYGDARAFVEKAPPIYDVVIMDMTDPEGPARFLYTKEFFEAVSGVFKDDNGLFAMHMESPAARPLCFACIAESLKAVFPILHTALAFVPMYATLWSFGYASFKGGPAVINREELEAKINTSMISAPLFTKPNMWPTLFAPDPIILDALKHKDARIITDSNPDFPDTFEG